MTGVGYREIVAHLRGEVTAEEAAERIRTQAWGPLVRLGLEPTPVNLETSGGIAMARLRFAADDRLRRAPRTEPAVDGEPVRPDDRRAEVGAVGGATGAADRDHLVDGIQHTAHAT